MINPAPYIVSRLGHLIKQGAAEALDLFRQASFQHSGVVCVLLKRSHLVQLPAEIHAGAYIVRPHKGVADNFAPLMVFFNPCLHILVVVRQKSFLFFLEFGADVKQLLHNFAGLFFGDGPAGHEPYAVPIEIVKCTGLERAKHLEVFRVGNALGTQRCQILRR